VRQIDGNGNESASTNERLLKRPSPRSYSSIVPTRRITRDIQGVPEPPTAWFSRFTVSIVNYAGVASRRELCRFHSVKANFQARDRIRYRYGTE